MNESLIILSMSGNDAFGACEEWLTKNIGKTICSKCYSVLIGVTDLEVRVNRVRRQTDLDLIGGGCFRVDVLSRRFVQAVSESLIRESAIIAALRDCDGVPIDRYVTAISKDANVIVRGAKESRVKLCSKCNRLLYWPVGARYVLRDAWNNMPIRFSNGEIFCGERFYEKVIRSTRLNRVAIERIPILDEPIDGLPSNISELKGAVALR